MFFSGNGGGHRDEVVERNGASQPPWDRTSSVAFAFRGYDVSNLGKSRELLEHPSLGATIAERLAEASEIASDTVHRRIDLADYVRAGAPTSINTFAEDIALIVAMEGAQIALLERFFSVPVKTAKLSFGYSIGEMSALILGGSYKLEEILPVPLAMAKDCAELASDTHMGVLFTRGPALDMDDVERLCEEVSSQGGGLIGPSAYLSPNTALLLAERDGLDRFEALMRKILPKGVNLRRNPNRWPPLHTRLVWKRNIPNRTATMLYASSGGGAAPSPPVLSCVTGDAGYTDWNSRRLLVKWTDHPQRLWDVIHETLAQGVKTVVHVGPEPKLIHATFTRLSNNINKHLSNKYIHMIGHGVATGIRRAAWLGRLLPSQTALLRAPFTGHVILEDWLLEQSIAGGAQILVPRSAGADSVVAAAEEFRSDAAGNA